MKKANCQPTCPSACGKRLFFSCGNTVNKNAYALEFDSIQVNETVHLFGDTAKPACNLILNVAYASQSSDVRLKDSLNAFFLSACFGDKLHGDDTRRSCQEIYGEICRRLPQ